MYPIVYCRFISTAGCPRQRGEKEICGWLILENKDIIRVARAIIKGK